VLRCGRRQRAGGLGEEEPAVTSLAMHRMCAWQGEEVAKLTGQHGDGGGGGGGEVVVWLRSVAVGAGAPVEGGDWRGALEHQER
jgi:hypothetical protein